MSEALLMSGIAAAGFLLLWPMSRLPVPIRAAIAFPVGLTTLLAIGMVMVALPTSYRPATSLAVLGVLAVLVAVVAVRMGEPGSTVRLVSWLAALAIATGLLSLGMRALSATILTPDSVRYLLIAGAMERSGGIDVVPLSDWLRRGVVVPIMRAPAGMLGRQHLASMSPILAISGIALLFGFASLALKHVGTPTRWRVWLIVAAVLAFLGSNRGIYHAFYLNGHLLFAVCLLVLVMGFWMAAVTGSVQWVLPAVPAIAVLVPLRPEAGLVIAPFLVAAMANRHLPRIAKWLPAVPFALASLGWFGLFLLPARETPFRLDQPEVGIVVVGVAIGLLAMLAALWPSSWVVRSSPAVSILGPAGVLAGFLLFSSGSVDRARESLAALGANLAVEGGWALTWWVLIPALAMAWAVARIPHQKLFTVPIAAFGVIFLLLPFLRESSYRVGTGYSGNRILMHIFLVLLMYVVIAAGWGAAHEESSELERAKEALVVSRVGSFMDHAALRGLPS